MTNEEAKVFLDNLKICIDEHPVVADWLIEIADRKTEPQKKEVEWVYNKRERLWYPYSNGEMLFKTENSSEKPNNCEAKNYCDDCLYADTCNSKEFFYACTSKATISKMEQVDEDINVRSKDEPQTEDADCDKCIWSVCNYNKAFAFEDEPQADCDGCQHYADKHTADACYECKRSYTDGYEPQTERSE